MPLGELNIPKFENNQKGKVAATITLTNNVDTILAERGFISPKEVRCVIVKSVLIDTSRRSLCIPTTVAQVLGLPIKHKTIVETLANSTVANVLSDVDLAIGGRRSLFDCLELTDLDIPLLGVLPMIALGIEPDIGNQILRMLATEEGQPYIYAL